jgi:hypothetical protein
MSQPPQQQQLASAFAPLCAFPPDPLVELRIQEEMSAAALDMPVQFGLYARQSTSAAACAAAPADFQLPAAAAETRPVFRAGDHVAMYGGLLRHTSEIDGAHCSHARRVPDSDFVLDGLPNAMLLKRPAPHTPDGLKLLVTAGMQPLLPSESRCSKEDVQRFFSGPLGFMSNTAAPQQCNVRMEHQAVNLGGGLVYQIPKLVAVCDIFPGDEILLPYNSNEARRIRAMASPAEGGGSSASGAGSRVPALQPRHNLMQGAVSHEAGLQQQLANLYRFVREHQSAFDRLIYEPWQAGRLDLPNLQQPKSLRLQQRRSIVLSPLLGVFVEERLNTQYKSVTLRSRSA